MLLTGNFTRTVDEKQRVAIPKQFRDSLCLKATGALYLAPGTDGSLALYTEEGFQQLTQRLAHSPPTQRDVRAFSRLFYASARRVELDKQGRIRVPVELAKRAELTKEVVLLGVGDHLELWDQRRWQEYQAQQSRDYDAIAEAAFAQTQRPTQEA